MLTTETRSEKKRETDSNYYFTNRGKIRAQQRAYYIANSEKIREHQRNRRATKPEKVRESDRKYRVNHPDKVRERQRKYRVENPEVGRAREQKRRASIRTNVNDSPTAEHLALLLKDPCVYCGDPSEHIDHVIPLVRGGEHTIDNLVPACAPCNRSKGSKLPVIEWNGRFSIQTTVVK